MFFNTPCKHISNNRKILQQSVDGLMPCPADLHVGALLLCKCVMRAERLRGHITTVGYISFSMVKDVMEGTLGNLEIIEGSTLEWTVHPHNPPRRDTDRHLISYAGALELVAVPCWTEGRRFLYPEICTINSNKNIAVRSTIVLTAIPINLTMARGRKNTTSSWSPSAKRSTAECSTAPQKRTTAKNERK
jgi:hypothetical protein